MLSDNIRKYRKLSNMSQDELAEKLNVTRQSISLWENGQTQPSLENIVALAKLFEVSTDELLVSDKITLPASNTVTAKKSDNTNSKTKFIFLILGIVIAVVALATVLFILTDTNNNSKDNPDTNNPQITIESEKNIFTYLKKFVIENGTTNGDYCYYSKSADNYGGYASENFSLYYWGDTNKIEFCLHSVIDETFSINFYLYVPEDHSGKYEYISSYYYRDTGEALYEAKGMITAEEFTDNYPLNCTKYFGSTEGQNAFMEISRQGICDLVGCLEKFIEVEDIEYSFEDFGFLKFKINRS